MLSNAHSLPFVSVIIPALNAESSIARALDALLSQSYPRNNYEIIVVDNGSTDKTREIIRQYPAVILLEEQKRGSYAARNAGIAKAAGDICAFTDADCVPDTDWIRQGVQFLEERRAYIAGGLVTFTFSSVPTAAEYVDSLIGINNEDSIQKHGMAATANLFVRRIALRKIGNFNASLASGGDGEWSARAKRAGEVMHFAKKTVVYHPARGFYQLWSKSVRIGSGSIAVWRARGKGLLWRVGAFLYLLTPLYAFRIPFMLTKYGSTQVASILLVRMMAVTYLIKIAQAWGIIKHTLRIRP